MPDDKKATETESGPMHPAEEKDRAEHPERYPQGATGSPAAGGDKPKDKDKDKDKNG